MNQFGKGRILGCSAGSYPNGRVNPVAPSPQQQPGDPVDGSRSSWRGEFATPTGPQEVRLETIGGAPGSDRNAR